MLVVEGCDGVYGDIGNVVVVGRVGERMVGIVEEVGRVGVGGGVCSDTGWGVCQGIRVEELGDSIGRRGKGVGPGCMVLMKGVWCRSKIGGDFGIWGSVEDRMGKGLSGYIGVVVWW